MNALLAFGFLAFLLCLCLTPLCRDLSVRFNLVDRPDTIRKFHLRAVPRIGGVPIVLSYVGALAIMLLFAPPWARISVQHRELILALVPAAGVIFLTGLLDDIFTLKPWKKLAGQAVAAVLAVSLGPPLSLSNGHPHVIWLSAPLSVLWLIGCTNAFNLIDGLDGLATGIGVFATLTVAIVAVGQGNMGLAMATAPLAGCLLAFLRYNFNPASVFLGDSGSLTLGFMLGCFSLIWSEHTGSFLGMTAPFMALALPLVDVGLAICRRTLRSQPIFEGDRSHIHHMVLARGFEPRQAALLLYAVCGLAASLAVLQSLTNYRFRGLILLFFFALVGIGVNYLGYVELTAAKRTISHRLFFRLIKEEIYMQELSHSLSTVSSVEDCWALICGVCRDLSFSSVKMCLNDEYFEHVFFNEKSDSLWKLTIGLGRSGHLTLTRTEEAVSPRHMMAVLESLRQVVHEREHIFNRTLTGSSA